MLAAPWPESDDNLDLTLETTKQLMNMKLALDHVSRTVSARRVFRYVTPLP